MEHARLKWNSRYESAHVPNQVIDVLELNLYLLSGQGKSLDLACGLGGNALRMAELGYESHAWDISDSAIAKVQEFSQERQLNVLTRQCDVSQERLQADCFDVIIVSRFLLRDIVPSLIAALKPGGLIYYQTFVQEQIVQEQIAQARKLNDSETQEALLQEPERPVEGPKNSHFRLATNELLSLFSGLTMRYYREDGLLGELDKGLRNEAMLVAQKTA